jgi:hypothetical protein
MKRREDEKWKKERKKERKKESQKLSRNIMFLDGKGKAL